MVSDGQLQRRNIEILKIRFGEAALQVCEVMLKDMTDSKRTDQHIQSQRDVSTAQFAELMSTYGANTSLSVSSTSYSHLATFLATTASKHLHHAWAIPAVSSLVFTLARR